MFAIPLWYLIVSISDLCTLTNSDLVSRNCIESGAYLLYSLRYKFQIWCVKASWNDEVPFTGHCDLDLVLRIIVSRAYLLYSLR